jgi:SAM-dependent methyltransferase
MRWDAARYARDGAFVPEHGRGVVDLLEPHPGERILDLGCGDGSLTREIAAAGASVLGVDASPAMVAAARDRGLDAVVGDAQRLAYDCEFDAVFTNAALHWMPDLPAVLVGVRRALRPGGRFVGELAAAGNIAAIGLAVSAARVMNGFGPVENPWNAPTADEWDELLRAAGLAPVVLTVFARPTPLPTGLRGWLELFGEPVLRDVPGERRRKVVADAVDVARTWLCDRSQQWTADYLRLRFRADRPPA